LSFLPCHFSFSFIISGLVFIMFRSAFCFSLPRIGFYHSAFLIFWFGLFMVFIYPFIIDTRSPFVHTHSKRNLSSQTLPLYPQNPTIIFLLPWSSLSPS
jgi:hypothetical protein